MIAFRQSPNYNERKDTREITYIVLHATASPNAAGANEWMCDPKSKVSAHYCIDKDGSTTQLVYEKDVAWHAGDSEFNGDKYINAHSVGIELANLNDGIDEYPAAQIAALTDIVKGLIHRHGIKVENIVSHADIALPKGRKTDPKGFPWDSWKAGLLT